MRLHDARKYITIQPYLYIARNFPISLKLISIILSNCYFFKVIQFLAAKLLTAGLGIGYPQKRIQNPIKDLRWSVLRK